MPKKMLKLLDEREIYSPSVCSTCTHGWDVLMDLSDDTVVRTFCLLGLSDEDRRVLCVELGDYIEVDQEFSKRFCKLMEIKNSEDLCISPRCMHVTDCCNKYA